MAMELINKADMAIWTPFAANTQDNVFESARRQVQDRLGAFISDELVTAILALTRDTGTSAEIYQFWENYVRPYVVHAVFVRLAELHGFNMQSQGFVVFTDRQNTSRPVDATERGAMIKQYAEGRELWLTNMLKRFSDVDGTFDGTAYEVDQDKYNTTDNRDEVIRMIGGVNRKLPYNNKFRL